MDVSLIVAMNDEREADWAPVALTGARAALLILNRIGRRGGMGDRLLHLAGRLASRATTLSGSRPDADASAPLILGHLDRVIDRGLPAQARADGRS
jgi:hypothetical protein